MQQANFQPVTLITFSIIARFSLDFPVHFVRDIRFLSPNLMTGINFIFGIFSRTNFGIKQYNL